PQLPQLNAVAPLNSSPPADKPTPSKAGLYSPIRSLSPSTSPILAPLPTSPPRLSTSSSQIFERNVQEHANTPSQPAPTSPAIPAHIQTDNHIPPVLEASSLAITDKACGVDEVEIVTTSTHQPAVSVVASSYSNATSPTVDAPHQHLSFPADHSPAEEAGNISSDDLSSYSTSGADKRRLSFISFADVVQAEQAESAASHTAHSSPRGSPVLDPVSISTINERLRRSPSPIRGGLGSSPPNGASRSGDNLGVERGELTVETMRQALRKTGSGDLGRS
ncbi:hypothetical protein EDC01DRAFT_590340, partial [Geopyxis carbonaria]